MLNERKQMNGSEIAKTMGISRQAVSYSLRKSMRKMYHHVLNGDLAESPFQAVITLMGMLGVDSNSVDDVKTFLKLFDQDIIDSVTQDAAMTYKIDN